MNETMTSDEYREKLIDLLRDATAEHARITDRTITVITGELLAMQATSVADEEKVVMR